MGIFDKAKEAISDHPDQANSAIDKAGDAIDERTGDKYAGQIDKGQEFAEGHLGNQDDPSTPPA